MTVGVATDADIVIGQSLERFDRFFAAVNDGATPYPWQRELLGEIARDGRWPAAIAMPTGAGKSSVVDVHVFLVAERTRLLAERARAGAKDADGATLAVARPPRRLLLVAPRRALVEDQHERASHLADRLERSLRKPDDEIVVEVAQALAGLCTSSDDDGVCSPLGVARLRGGVRLDLGWRLDPAQCQVICATPQMWGSRLLLRGYRGTRRARNLEAGLLGHDVAVAIDEAHLHERLVETTVRIASEEAGPLRLQAVAMSATRVAAGARTLSERDLADPELRRRVRASKRLQVVEVESWRRDAVAVLTEQAQALAGDGTVGVFVNTVPMALEVAERLDGEVVVVCGRMRPADLAQLRDDRPGLLDARGNAAVDYLVSTQSLEVGVDLDLPALVTAIAPATALAQRAGRLNRSGRRDSAELVVVAPSALADADLADLDRQFAPYSGADIVAAARWLDALGGDASPERISQEPPPGDTERIPLPALTRVELETLAIAGHTLAADVDAGFYVDEPRDRAERQVSIGARDHLDLPPETVRAALLAAPPRAHELASISLLGTALPRLLDAVTAAGGCAWLLRERAGEQSAEPVRDPGQLEPGDVVVVPHRSLICTRGIIGLGRGSRGEPIAEVTAKRPDGQPDVVVPIDRAAIEPVLEDDRSLGGRRARSALADALDADGHANAAALLRGHKRLGDLDVTWCPPPEDAERPVGLLALTPTWREGVLPTTAAGEAVVTVDDHGEAVEQRLSEILDALDLVDEHDLGVGRERLLTAARWHDEGKRHPRFQRRMGAEPGGPALAKPAPGHRADRGDGLRHEQISAGFAWTRSDRDPVPTVVCCGHHGHGLPLFDRGPEAALDGWDDCDADVREALTELFGPCGRYELERARLTRTLGLHRLTFLEALLRCADMQVSREGR